MSKKLTAEPLAFIKSSCLRRLEADLVYENENVIDYASDEGALFLISENVDPEPSSVVIKNFPELKKLKHDHIEYYQDTLMLNEYQINLSQAKIFSTADIYLKKVDKVFYSKLNYFVKKNYSCELYVSAAKEVCQRLLEFKPEAVFDPRALESLVGFGIGMTPSGDDFLVGLMASLKGTSYFEEVSEALNKLLGKTNSISREFLRCAARGEFSASFAELILAGNKSIDPEKHFIKIIHKGHTSGVESLLGFLKGLEIRRNKF